MPTFSHDFIPASASTLGATVDLTARSIEDAGLLEILQTPGPATGPWGLFNALLDPTNAEFRFLEPLGQSREVKTALSGLFGRFVARAYATHHLGLTYFTHIRSPPMRLSGYMRGVLRRVRGRRGDMPDWVAWGPDKGMAIVEAKGSHEKPGPRQTRDRAFAQAERAEIRAKNGLARFKRYAIVTRWGFVAPPWEPMIWVRDPEEAGDDIPLDDLHGLQAGVARLHYASLLSRLGEQKLATALRTLAGTPYQNQYSAAQRDARAALDDASVRDIAGTRDELVGGYVTRGGILPTDVLSEDDLATLARLNMRPAFVGVERPLLKLAVEGDIPAIESRRLSTGAAIPTDHGPQDDGAGVWIVRLDEDAARIGPAR